MEEKSAILAWFWKSASEVGVIVKFLKLFVDFFVYRYEKRIVVVGKDFVSGICFRNQVED